MEKEGLTGCCERSYSARFGYSGKITFCTASFPCAAHVRSARLIKQSTQKRLHKREDKRRKSGSETRLGEIIPARMEAGEPPREASIHAEPARWKKLPRKSNLYLRKLTFGAVFPAAPDTRRLYQPAKRSCSWAAGVIFCLFQGRLSSSLSAFR